MVANKKEWDPLDHLRALKAYSNEIPSEIIHSDSPENRYKVRKGWFIAVAWTFEIIIAEQSVQDPKLNRLFHGYVRWLETSPFMNRLTKPGEIDVVDRIVDRILNSRQ